MENLLPVLRVLAEWFAWHPLRCAFVAAIFTVFALLPLEERFGKLVVCGAAAMWWYFAYVEATTPMTWSMRFDLLLILPVAMVLGLCALVAVALTWPGRKFNQRP